MWRKNSLGLLYRTPAHGNNQPESGMASFLEIISRSYDMALDRWTGEDWFGRLKPKKKTGFGPWHVAVGLIWFCR